MRLTAMWRLGILTVALALLAVGAGWAVLTFAPPGQRTVPSVIALVVIGAAIVLLDYLVLKPAIVLYAKQRAREYAAGGGGAPEQMRKISRALARAGRDAEARELLQKLRERAKGAPEREKND